MASHMLDIILVRPGQTDYDVQGRIRSLLKLPMTQEGTQQAEAMAVDLQNTEVSAVYTSPCLAAKQTAEVLSRQFHVKIRELESLENWNTGLWQGKLITEVKKNQPKIYRMRQESPESVCPPQGEILDDVRSRLQTALDKIWKKHQKHPGKVVVITPEPLASVFRELVTHDAIGDLWEAERRCGWWETLHYEKNPVAGKV